MFILNVFKNRLRNEIINYWLVLADSNFLSVIRLKSNDVSTIISQFQDVSRVSAEWGGEENHNAEKSKIKIE